MSIIDPKYKGKYKGPSDWIGELINAQCVGTTEGNKGLNLDDLFKMADLNKIETQELEAQRTVKNAPGRIRMTLGNSLRAVAKKRHGLYGADGKWYKVPEGFAAGELTEDKEGASLVKKAEPKTATQKDEAKPKKGKAA